jgi:hypothetical protein
MFRLLFADPVEFGGGGTEDIRIALRSEMGHV